MKILANFAVSLTMLLSFVPAANGNLLLNGDFETTNNGFSQSMTPANWTNVGHPDGVIAYSLFGTPAYNGNYLYNLGGFGIGQPNSGDGIEQTVATTAGLTYKLTFGLTGENAANYSEALEVFINGVLLQSFVVPYNSSVGPLRNSFATQTLYYLATSSSTTITFSVTGSTLGANDPVIDGVDFDVAAPEPATILLAGVSVCGLLILRRLKPPRTCVRRVLP